MLTEKEALAALKKLEPARAPKHYILYQNLYIFFAPHETDEAEGIIAPFFSVDMLTGEAKDFSIVHDGNPSELLDLLKTPLEVKRG